jgi:hypothetical protein
MRRLATEEREVPDQREALPVFRFGYIDVSRGSRQHARTPDGKWRGGSRKKYRLANSEMREEKLPLTL